MSESFVAYIEAAFTEPLKAYGFVPVRKEHVDDPFNFDIVRYECDGRSVEVCYEHYRDAYCRVEIGGYGAFQPVTDLFLFARGPSGEEPKGLWTRDAATFATDAMRCSDLLQRYCHDFLRGDIEAFRRQYRELLLVAAVRNARYNAAAMHRWEDYDKYNVWLSDYHTQFDRAEIARYKKIRQRFDSTK